MAKRKSTSRSNLPNVLPEQIGNLILIIRGHKVLLDEQLAAFYGVETKRLMEAVRRNLQRFPDDFMFQLNREEWDALKSPDLRSQFATSSLAGYGGRRYAPNVFTEQGVATLTSVL
jgi:hypothetical protein